MIVSSLYPRFRDTAIIWGVLATVLFYGTPVLYPLEIVPETLRDVIEVNPLAPLFELARLWVIDPTAPGPGGAAGDSAPPSGDRDLRGRLRVRGMGVPPGGTADRRAAVSSAVAPGGDPGKEARAASGIPVVPAFDGYRAYAILAIVALHLLFFAGGHAPLVTDERVRARSLPRSARRSTSCSWSAGSSSSCPTVARGGDFGSFGVYAIRRAARLAPAYWLPR